MDFNKNWTFHKEGSADVINVSLPHDAQLTEKRAADYPSGNGGAFFPGGLYHYEKSFFVPEDWKDKSIFFEFEGIYKNPEIYINGAKAGAWRYGYSVFSVCADAFLKYGEENLLHVVADNRQTPNSRWYSGAGVFRPVNLYVKNKRHIELDGVTIRTISCSPAIISVDVKSSQGEISVEIFDQGKPIAKAYGSHTEIQLPGAKLWSAESPALYECRVMFSCDGEVCDEVTETFGVRKISWDNKGFYINGERTLLQGGCLHHDNGVVGAASYEKLEWRKIRILKQYGFNAIRSSHNPISRSMLRACDALGMYVIDEAFDMWYTHKTKYDYSLDFEEWYERDLGAMVRKDFNHPSVIMYSTGNELTEPYEEKGVMYARKITSLLHELDCTRPVTSGVNLMLLSMAAMGNAGFVSDSLDKGEEVGNASQNIMFGDGSEPVGSAMFNKIMSQIGQKMNKAAATPEADKASAAYFDALDICGYNYASNRYAMDKRLHPNRLIYGSETMHYTLAKNWEKVKKYEHVCGDFCWTAWDYLGECGIGGWSHDLGISFGRQYPWLVADTGALDLLGNPTGPAALAKAVWGAAKKPEIYVRPVDRQEFVVAMWRGTNSIPSWSWRGQNGVKTVVEVYSDSPMAELFINGKSAGVKKVKEYVAKFSVRYEPGVLTAKAIYPDKPGIEAAPLKSAEGELSLVLHPEDQHVLVGDIVVIDIDIAGENGITESNCDSEVSVKIEGGSLFGFGSAAQKTTGSFLDGKYKTRYGKAMAVVHADREGTLTVSASSDGIKSGKCEIFVDP